MERIIGEVQESTEEMQVVAFSVGDEQFAIDIAYVHDIIKPNDITCIPNSRNFIDGVINLRGRINVVVDLAVKIGFQKKDFAPETRIVVIEIYGDQLGLRVDSVSDTIKFQKSKVQPTPLMIQNKVGKEYISGIYKISDEQLLLLLDINKIFPEIDPQSIKDMAS